MIIFLKKVIFFLKKTITNGLFILFYFIGNDYFIYITEWKDNHGYKIIVMSLIQKKNIR